MVFKRLALGDIETVSPYFDYIDCRTCDFTVGGMFMWRDFYKMEFCIKNDIFFSRLYSEEGKVYYNIPLCEDIEAGLCYLKNLSENNGEKMRFCTVPEKYLSVFYDVFDNATVTEQVNYGDYLYSFDDLCYLKGKKYNGQRNQIHQFLRNEDWKFERITVDDIDEIEKFFRLTYVHSLDRFALEEDKKTDEVINNFENYHMEGWKLTTGSRIVGFSFCEVLKDVLFIHIEKADRNCKGAYQTLMNNVAKQYADKDVKFINREEDMGDIGLRTSKESYHPIGLLKKFIVEVG